jgi:hypothetical protein
MISNDMHAEAKGFYASALQVLSKLADGVLHVRNGYVLSGLARVLCTDSPSTALALRLNAEALTALR